MDPQILADLLDTFGADGGQAHLPWSLDVDAAVFGGGLGEGLRFEANGREWRVLQVGVADDDMNQSSYRSDPQLRDAARVLPPVCFASLVSQYTRLLRDPRWAVTEVPAVMSAMLHDPALFHVMDANPLAPLSEYRVTAMTRWWAVRAKPALCYKNSSGRSLKSLRCGGDDGGGDVATLTALHSTRCQSSGLVSEEEVREVVLGDAHDTTPVHDDGTAADARIPVEELRERYRDIKTVLTLIAATSAPYRCSRPPNAAVSGCTARLVFCKDPSTIYLGLLLNTVLRELPRKVLCSMPVFCLIAEGWGNAPSMHDVLQAAWEEYLDVVEEIRTLMEANTAAMTAREDEEGTTGSSRSPASYCTTTTASHPFQQLPRRPRFSAPRLRFPSQPSEESSTFQAGRSAVPSSSSSGFAVTNDAPRARQTQPDGGNNNMDAATAESGRSIELGIPLGRARLNMLRPGDQARFTALHLERFAHRGDEAGRRFVDGTPDSPLYEALTPPSPPFTAAAADAAAASGAASGNGGSRRDGPTNTTTTATATAGPDGGNTTYRTEDACSICIESMQECAQSPELLLWWARCRLLAYQLLDSASRVGVESTSALDFFLQLWSCAPLAREILEDDHEALLHAPDSNVHSQTPAQQQTKLTALQQRGRRLYANLVGTVADLSKFWFTVRVAQSTLNVVGSSAPESNVMWSIVNATVPCRRRFQREEFMSYAEHWQYALLVDDYVSQPMGFRVSTRGRTMVTQLLHVLMEYPTFYPALVTRTLAMLNRREMIVAELNGRLVAAVARCLRFYLPPMPPALAAPSPADHPSIDTAIASATAAAVPNTPHGDSPQLSSPPSSLQTSALPVDVAAAAAADQHGFASSSSSSSSPPNSSSLRASRHSEAAEGHSTPPAPAPQEPEGAQEIRSTTAATAVAEPAATSSLSSSSAAAVDASASGLHYEAYVMNDTASDDGTDGGSSAEEGEASAVAAKMKNSATARLEVLQRQQEAAMPVITTKAYDAVLTCLDVLRMLIRNGHQSVNPMNLLFTLPSPMADGASAATGDTIAAAAEPVASASSPAPQPAPVVPSPAQEEGVQACSRIPTENTGAAAKAAQASNAEDEKKEKQHNGLRFEPPLPKAQCDLYTLLHQLVSQTRYGPLATAALRLFSACIHFNVRDTVPLFAERGLLNTVLWISRRPRPLTRPPSPPPQPAHLPGGNENPSSGSPTAMAAAPLLFALDMLEENGLPNTASRDGVLPPQPAARAPPKVSTDTAATHEAPPLSAWINASSAAGTSLVTTRPSPALLLRYIPGEDPYLNDTSIWMVLPEFVEAMTVHQDTHAVFRKHPRWISALLESLSVTPAQSSTTLADLRDLWADTVPCELEEAATKKNADPDTTTAVVTAGHGCEGVRRTSAEAEDSEALRRRQRDQLECRSSPTYRRLLQALLSSRGAVGAAANSTTSPAGHDNAEVERDGRSAAATTTSTAMTSPSSPTCSVDASLIRLMELCRLHLKREEVGYKILQGSVKDMTRVLTETLQSAPMLTEKFDHALQHELSHLDAAVRHFADAVRAGATRPTPLLASSYNITSSLAEMGGSLSAVESPSTQDASTPADVSPHGGVAPSATSADPRSTPFPVTRNDYLELLVRAMELCRTFNNFFAFFSAMGWTWRHPRMRRARNPPEEEGTQVLKDILLGTVERFHGALQPLWSLMGFQAPPNTRGKPLSICEQGVADGESSLLSYVQVVIGQCLHPRILADYLRSTQPTPTLETVLRSTVRCILYHSSRSLTYRSCPELRTTALPRRAAARTAVGDEEGVNPLLPSPSTLPEDQAFRRRELRRLLRAAEGDAAAVSAVDTNNNDDEEATASMSADTLRGHREPVVLESTDAPCYDVISNVVRPLSMGDGVFLRQLLEAWRTATVGGGGTTNSGSASAFGGVVSGPFRRSADMAEWRGVFGDVLRYVVDATVVRADFSCDDAPHLLRSLRSGSTSTVLANIVPSLYDRSAESGAALSDPCHGSGASRNPTTSSFPDDEDHHHHHHHAHSGGAAGVTAHANPNDQLMQSLLQDSRNFVAEPATAWMTAAAWHAATTGCPPAATESAADTANRAAPAAVPLPFLSTTAAGADVTDADAGVVADLTATAPSSLSTQPSSHPAQQDSRPLPVDLSSLEDVIVRVEGESGLLADSQGSGISSEDSSSIAMTPRLQTTVADTPTHLTGDAAVGEGNGTGAAPAGASPQGTSAPPGTGATTTSAVAATAPLSVMPPLFTPLNPVKALQQWIFMTLFNGRRSNVAPSMSTFSHITAFRRENRTRMVLPLDVAVLVRTMQADLRGAFADAVRGVYADTQTRRECRRQHATIRESEPDAYAAAMDDVVAMRRRQHCGTDARSAPRSSLSDRFLKTGQCPWLTAKPRDLVRVPLPVLNNIDACLSDINFAAAHRVLWELAVLEAVCAGGNNGNSNLRDSDVRELGKTLTYAAQLLILLSRLFLSPGTSTTYERRRDTSAGLAGQQQKPDTAAETASRAATVAAQGELRRCVVYMGMLMMNFLESCDSRARGQHHLVLESLLYCVLDVWPTLPGFPMLPYMYTTAVDLMAQLKTDTFRNIQLHTLRMTTLSPLSRCADDTPMSRDDGGAASCDQQSDDSLPCVHEMIVAAVRDHTDNNSPWGHSHAPHRLGSGDDDDNNDDDDGGSSARVSPAASRVHLWDRMLPWLCDVVTGAVFPLSSLSEGGHRVLRRRACKVFWSLWTSTRAEEQPHVLAYLLHRVLSDTRRNVVLLEYMAVLLSQLRGVVVVEALALTPLPRVIVGVVKKAIAAVAVEQSAWEQQAATEKAQMTSAVGQRALRDVRRRRRRAFAATQEMLHGQLVNFLTVFQDSRGDAPLVRDRFRRSSSTPHNGQGIGTQCNYFDATRSNFCWHGHQCHRHHVVPVNGPHSRDSEDDGYALDKFGAGTQRVVDELLTVLETHGFDGAPLALNEPSDGAATAAADSAGKSRPRSHRRDPAVPTGRYPSFRSNDEGTDGQQRHPVVPPPAPFASSYFVSRGATGVGSRPSPFHVHPALDTPTPPSRAAHRSEHDGDSSSSPPAAALVRHERLTPHGFVSMMAGAERQAGATAADGATTYAGAVEGSLQRTPLHSHSGDHDQEESRRGRSSPPASTTAAEHDEEAHVQPTTVVGNHQQRQLQQLRDQRRQLEDFRRELADAHERRAELLRIAMAATGDGEAGRQLSPTEWGGASLPDQAAAALSMLNARAAARSSPEIHVVRHQLRNPFSSGHHDSHTADPLRRAIIPYFALFSRELCEEVLKICLDFMAARLRDQAREAAEMAEEAAAVTATTTVVCAPAHHPQPESGARPLSPFDQEVIVDVMHEARAEAPSGLSSVVASPLSPIPPLPVPAASLSPAAPTAVLASNNTATAATPAVPMVAATTAMSAAAQLASRMQLRLVEVSECLVSEVMVHFLLTCFFTYYRECLRVVQRYHPRAADIAGDAASEAAETEARDTSHHAVPPLDALSVLCAYVTSTNLPNRERAIILCELLLTDLPRIEDDIWQAMTCVLATAVQVHHKAPKLTDKSFAALTAFHEKRARALEAAEAKAAPPTTPTCVSATATTTASSTTGHRKPATSRGTHPCQRRAAPLSASGAARTNTTDPCVSVEHLKAEEEEDVQGLHQHIVPLSIFLANLEPYIVRQPIAFYYAFQRFCEVRWVQGRKGEVPAAWLGVLVQPRVSGSSARAKAAAELTGVPASRSHLGKGVDAAPAGGGGERRARTAASPFAAAPTTMCPSREFSERVSRFAQHLACNVEAGRGRASHGVEVLAAVEQLPGVCTALLTLSNSIPVPKIYASVLTTQTNAIAAASHDPSSGVHHAVPSPPQQQQQRRVVASTNRIAVPPFLALLLHFCGTLREADRNSPFDFAAGIDFAACLLASNPAVVADAVMDTMQKLVSAIEDLHGAAAGASAREDGDINAAENNDDDVVATEEEECVRQAAGDASATSGATTTRRRAAAQGEQADRLRSLTRCLHDLLCFLECGSPRPAVSALPARQRAVQQLTGSNVSQECFLRFHRYLAQHDLLSLLFRVCRLRTCQHGRDATSLLQLLHHQLMAIGEYKLATMLSPQQKAYVAQLQDEAQLRRQQGGVTASSTTESRLTSWPPTLAVDGDGGVTGTELRHEPRLDFRDRFIARSGHEGNPPSYTRPNAAPLLDSEGNTPPHLGAQRFPLPTTIPTSPLYANAEAAAVADEEGETEEEATRYRAERIIPIHPLSEAESADHAAEPDEAEEGEEPEMWEPMRPVRRRRRPSLSHTVPDAAVEPVAAGDDGDDDVYSEPEGATTIAATATSPAASAYVIRPTDHLRRHRHHHGGDADSADGDGWEDYSSSENEEEESSEAADDGAPRRHHDDDGEDDEEEEEGSRDGEHNVRAGWPAASRGMSLPSAWEAALHVSHDDDNELAEAEAEDMSEDEEVEEDDEENQEDDAENGAIYESSDGELMGSFLDDNALDERYMTQQLWERVVVHHHGGHPAGRTAAAYERAQTFAACAYHAIVLAVCPLHRGNTVETERPPLPALHATEEEEATDERLHEPQGITTTAAGAAAAPEERGGALPHTSTADSRLNWSFGRMLSDAIVHADAQNARQAMRDSTPSDQLMRRPHESLSPVDSEPTPVQPSANDSTNAASSPTTAAAPPPAPAATASVNEPSATPTATTTAGPHTTPANPGTDNTSGVDDITARILELFAAGSAQDSNAAPPALTAAPVGAAAASFATESAGPEPWEGVLDVQFLIEMPEDVRSEILFDSMQVLRGDEEREVLGQRTRLYPGFLRAMTEAGQRHAMEVEARWVRITRADDSANELYQTVLSVDAETRRDLLLQCDLEQLQPYPELLREATELRAEVERQRAELEAAQRAQEERRQRQRDLIMQRAQPHRSSRRWMMDSNELLRDDDDPTGSRAAALRAAQPWMSEMETVDGVMRVFYDGTSTMYSVVNHELFLARRLYRCQEVLQRLNGLSASAPGSVAAMMMMRGGDVGADGERIGAAAAPPSAWAMSPLMDDDPFYRLSRLQRPSGSRGTNAPLRRTPPLLPLLMSGGGSGNSPSRPRPRNASSSPLAPHASSAFPTESPPAPFATLPAAADDASAPLPAFEQIPSDAPTALAALSQSVVPVQESPFHPLALPVPQVPDAIVADCLELLRLRATAALSLPYNATAGISCLDQQLQHLLQLLMGSQTSASRMVCQLLDVMANTPTATAEASEAAAAAGGVFAVPAVVTQAAPTVAELAANQVFVKGAIAFLVALMKQNQTMAASFFLLPDGTLNTATLKPVESPMDAVERRCAEYGLWNRLWKVCRQHVHVQGFVYSLDQLLRQLVRSQKMFYDAEEDNEIRSTSDPLAEEPLTESLILHPRHPHRLRWTNIRRLSNYEEGGYVCNVCGVNPSYDYCFHCSSCQFDLCPTCSRDRLTLEETRIRIRRSSALLLMAVPETVTSMIAFLRHPLCRPNIAANVVQLMSRGMQECAAREGAAAPSALSPLPSAAVAAAGTTSVPSLTFASSNSRGSAHPCLSAGGVLQILEQELVQVAEIRVRAMKEARDAFRQEVHTILHATPRAATTTTATAAVPGSSRVDVTMTTGSLGSMAAHAIRQQLSIPDGYIFDTDTAMALLLKLDIRDGEDDAIQRLFELYTPTSGAEPRAFTMLWRASQAYLHDVSTLLEHLTPQEVLPLPSCVSSILQTFCRYHLNDVHGRNNSSASARTLTGSCSNLAGETEHFLHASTKPSSVSDRAVRELAEQKDAAQWMTAVGTRLSEEGLSAAEEHQRRLPRVVRMVLEENRVTLNTLLHWNSNLLNESMAFLRHEPNAIDFNFKLSDFRRRLGKRRGSSILLRVKRENCLLDSFKEIQKQKSLDGQLHVRFEGEEGADAGGLTREWLQILSEALVDERYALFVHSQDSSSFQPNPFSSVNPNHLEYFQFAGVVVALAIRHNVPIDIHFTRAFYRHIIGHRPVFSDLQSFDPELYTNLNWIMENDVTNLALTFAVNYNRFGSVEEEELEPNGKNTMVTNANKQQYVRLLCEFHMTKRTEEQLLRFLKGFYSVIPRREIQCFTENELELVISGMPDIDVEDLRRHTLYEGYSTASPQVRWFWDAVSAMTKEDLANLLQFATGSSKVPHGGFGHFEGANGRPLPFTISRWAVNKDDLLPQAHTCFNKIDLPVYASAAVLKEKLMLAITYGSMGFTMV
jgi:E3 ubiquitin-protein ligase HUWE1